MYKNPNAFNATILSNETLAQGANPFVVEKKDVPLVPYSGSDSVTMFAEIANQGGDFLIDFNSDNIVVWGINCTQSLGATPDSSCSKSPTNTNFMNYNPSTECVWTGSYEGNWISGFETNGQIYKCEVCVGSVCRV